MLELLGAKQRFCDGVSRRQFLRIGALTGAGLALPAAAELRAQSTASKPRVRSVIQLFMWGGPSQHETFDPKPNAPEGIRGNFKPIATSVVGTRICEHLPMLAARAHQYAIVRSVTHTGVNHGTSAYHMLTGHIHFSPGTLRHPSPNDYPSLGCAVGKFGPQPPAVPTYVSLPAVLHDGDGGEVPGQGPGMLGQRYSPFQALGDPTRPDFSIDTLTLPEDVAHGRLQQRKSLQSLLEQAHNPVGKLPQAAAMQSHYEQAYRLLESPATRRAFDLRLEADRVRERFGMHHFGQSCLLARRLVEAGVPMITVYWNAPHINDLQHWDTHKDSFERLKVHLLPHFELGFSALLDDLQARGLLDETLILWHGEFGRTPKINKSGGRDHWGYSSSVVLAGGGVRGGLVYGSSDAHAAYAAEQPVSPDDLAATVFESLGVPLDTELQDAQARPVPLCAGKPIRGLR